MSFLNPVNEPVLRFSSTDADAPQINYAARTAGDVKTVIKACLVTGYGATTGAGWTVVNEIDHVAEFVSPSAAMSDYRLGIDDSSAASTTWFDVRAAASTAMGSALSKDATSVDKADPLNAWHLIASDKGLVFVEFVQHKFVKSLGARVTYYGQLKSALTTTTENISWWSIGFYAPNNKLYPSSFYSAGGSDKYYKLSDLVLLNPSFLFVDAARSTADITNISQIDVVSDMYYSASNNIVACQPGVALKLLNNTDKSTSQGVIEINGRSFLAAWPVSPAQNPDITYLTSHVLMLIPLDYWEY